MQLVCKIQFKRVGYSLLTLTKFSVSLKRGYLGYMAIRKIDIDQYILIDIKLLLYYHKALKCVHIWVKPNTYNIVEIN